MQDISWQINEPKFLAGNKQQGGDSPENSQMTINVVPRRKRPQTPVKLMSYKSKSRIF